MLNQNLYGASIIQHSCHKHSQQAQNPTSRSLKPLFYDLIIVSTNPMQGIVDGLPSNIKKIEKNKNKKHGFIP